MKIKIIVEGGKMQPGPAVAQQLGPRGINIGKVIADVNKETAGFSGIKVPVELDVNGKTKTYTIKVFSPPVAELIKKELSLEKGSGTPNLTKVGNIALETIVGIAKTKLSSLLEKDLKAAVKLIVGTCVSMGILIDNKEAKLVKSEIDEGKYDREIKNEITVPSAEKKKILTAYFAEIKTQQERAKKAAEEAKAAAEAAAAGSAVKEESTTAPVEEKKEEKKEAEAKKPEKKEGKAKEKKK